MSIEAKKKLQETLKYFKLIIKIQHIEICGMQPM